MEETNESDQGLVRDGRFGLFFFSLLLLGEGKLHPTTKESQISRKQSLNSVRQGISLNYTYGNYGAKGSVSHTTYSLLWKRSVVYIITSQLAYCIYTFINSL